MLHNSQNHRAYYLTPSNFRDQLLSLSKVRPEAVSVWLETFHKLLSRAAKPLSNDDISIKCRIPDCVDKSFILAGCFSLPLEEGNQSSTIFTSHPTPWIYFFMYLLTACSQCKVFPITTTLCSISGHHHTSGLSFTVLQNQVL